MKHPAGLVELAGRGVYWARYTQLGSPIIYAIDSQGDVVKRILVRDHSRANDANEYLWNYLEAVDCSQRPILHLMKPRTLELPSTERPAHLEVLDPYGNLPLPGHFPRRA